MVAAAECPELPIDLAGIDATQNVEDAKLLESIPQRLAGVREHKPASTVATCVDRLVVRVESDRNSSLDARAECGERIRKIAGGELGANRAHAAADVDADGRRDDRCSSRDDRADRCTLAEVDVRHDRYVTGQDRKRSDVTELLNRVPLDFYARGPRLQVRNRRQTLETHV